MTDEEEKTGSQATESEGEDEDKLDLAAVAAQLAAKSGERRGDPALAAGADSEVVAEAAGDVDEPVESEESDESEDIRAALGSDEDEDRADDGPELAIGEHQLSGAEVYAAVEALLFAADKPVTPAQMARALPAGVNAREVRKQLKAMREELDEAERGFELMEIAGGWQLLTREKFASYVTKLKKTSGGRKLSGSALETLAVVAYKQPVTRAEIERIRGVACGDMLRNLMEKRLVKIAGRSPELGNPLLYGTTQDFLDHFGLGSLSDLPRSSELGRKPKPTTPSVPRAGGGGEEESADGAESAAVDTDSDSNTDSDTGGGEQVGAEVEGKDGLDTDPDSDTDGHAAGDGDWGEAERE